jgi:hypothetical protein
MTGTRRIGGSAAFRYVSPASRLLADNAWAASSVTLSGSNTATWVPTRGATTLVLQGTTQLQPAIDSRLNNRLAVPWGAAGGYAGTIAALGDAQSWFWAGYITADNAGLWALTNAGTVNTGSSGLATGGLRSRRLAGSAGVDAIGPSLVARAVVAVGTMSLTGASVYANTYTPASSAVVATTFSQTSFVLGALDAANTFALTGAVAEFANWSRVLSPAEIAATLRSAGRYYGVPIT